MRTLQQWLQYQQLEQIEPIERSKLSHDTRPSSNQWLKAWMDQVGQAWFSLWDFSAELRIQERVDRTGTVRWRVEDPANERVLWFDSPQEVSTWLESCDRNHSALHSWDL
ncbi:MAG: hypothetical protein ACTS2F_30885 [Thainema sp.]